ncbi:MAG: polyhydroxyalkanoate synthesis regulator DNA-binding domain-containing protein [Myxococcota bacterium]|jgi:polyhydroxyalkanoate synthesis repressor PhaR|nr:polyhydroxyalkanoate synthesis regulator DNA-binding domain-containing protein [Myxococcota bacterium]
MVTIKKYSNRRLYDTSQSRYITQDELAEMIRAGAEPKVVDAKSGEDLTQATLTQIVMESRGASKHLSVPVLLQMIRMDAGALAEFLGQTVGWALQLYLSAIRGVASLPGMGSLPFANPLASLMTWGPWRGGAERGGESVSEVELLRREVQTLKSELDAIKDKQER